MLFTTGGFWDEAWHRRYGGFGDDFFISAKPTQPIHYIVQQLKGFSSHELRGKYEHLRKKLPTLWSRSYYVGTAGYLSQTVIQNYIAQQKGK